MATDDRHAEWWCYSKIAFGYVLAGGVAWLLLCYVSKNIGIDSDYWFNVLILLFGGLLGWVTGILATPRGPEERASFSSYAAAISTFLSGFVVAKVDQAFKVELTNGFDRVDLARMMLFASAFLLGMLCTFMGRLYLGTRFNTQSSAKSPNPV